MKEAKLKEIQEDDDEYVVKERPGEGREGDEED